MFINDDGLQIIDEDERRARIEFYADHSIGWTARPKHGLNGFVRKGKFKKVRCLYKLFRHGYVSRISHTSWRHQPIGRFRSILVATLVEISWFRALWRWDPRGRSNHFTHPLPKMANVLTLRPPT